VENTPPLLVLPEGGQGLNQKKGEAVIKFLLMVAAVTSIVVVVLIVVFVVAEALPAFNFAGVINIVTGLTWHPLQDQFGVLPMIVGSIYVTLGAMVLGVPFGVGTAIFLAELAPPAMSKVVRPAIELLAGIPSVIYGLFGMTLIVPLVRRFELAVLGSQADPQLTVGYGVIASAIVLTIMVLPTITNIAEDAIRAVPEEFREGSLSLGATRWQTITGVVLPAAKSGLVAAVVLGMGRAIGETMAVIMVAGNTPLMPSSIFSPVRTLTGNIAIESGYATGLHESGLFATGVVLFVMIFLLEIIAWKVRQGVKQHA